MTKKDLMLQYQKEHGEYPEDEPTYIEWLEDLVLSNNEVIDRFKDEIIIIKTQKNGLCT